VEVPNFTGNRKNFFDKVIYSGVGGERGRKNVSDNIRRNKKEDVGGTDSPGHVFRAWKSDRDNGDVSERKTGYLEVEGGTGWEGSGRERGESLEPAIP